MLFQWRLGFCAPENYLQYIIATSERCSGDWTGDWKANKWLKGGILLYVKRDKRDGLNTWDY